jgi:phosphatidylglycerol:prolipoprotein diacylglycerol transferase
MHSGFDIQLFGVDLRLPAYTTMLVIGFVIVIFLARRWAVRNGLHGGRMVDFGILMFLWGIVGSRLLHIVADGHFWDYVNVCLDPSKVDWRVDERECTAALHGAWDAAEGVCHPIATNCLAALDITAGGFAYYGGFIAAALFSIWFVKRHRWPAGKICDMAGFTISLGLVWGRMGCFLASCCFGARTDLPFAVSFPSGSAASRQQWEDGLLGTYRVESLPVHPTQIYEALAALAIAAFVYFVVAPRKRFDGQVFVVAMALYAIARFAVEFIRRDERGGLLGLSTSQIVAVGMLALCAWFWIHFKRAASRAV